jgi:hypothetical protein
MLALLWSHRVMRRLCASRRVADFRMRPGLRGPSPSSCKLPDLHNRRPSSSSSYRPADLAAHGNVGDSLWTVEVLSVPTRPVPVPARARRWRPRQAWPLFRSRKPVAFVRRRHGRAGCVTTPASGTGDGCRDAGRPFSCSSFAPPHAANVLRVPMLPRPPRVRPS